MVAISWCGCVEKVNGVSSKRLLRSCCLIRVRLTAFQLWSSFATSSTCKSVILNIFCRQRTVAYTSMRAGRMDVAIFIINTVFIAMVVIQAATLKFDAVLLHVGFEYVLLWHCIMPCCAKIHYSVCRGN